jgi:hypothetical protein
MVLIKHSKKGAIMGAIIGGISGLVVLMMTYLGTREAPKVQQIQEVRMQGLVESTKKSSAPGMLWPGLGLESLRRSDYSIVGTAKGEGCAKYVALWPIPIFWVKRDGGAIKWFTADAEGVATNAAWYQAIESLPEADAMISPRKRVKEENRFALWYRRDCVSLNGKGIEIHLDKHH